MTIKFAVEVFCLILVSTWTAYFLGSILHRYLDKVRFDLKSENESKERALREVTEALERLAIILIYHDATVRGCNPEQTKGSVDELLEVIKKRYPPCQS